MIDEVDRRLKDWVKSILEGVEVHLTAPGNAMEPGATEERGIGLYLMEVAVMPPASTSKLPPLQVALRFLVTSWSEDPEDAHRLLGELVFAAMENPEFEVELAPVPMAVWGALGVPPRPSFVLRVLLKRARHMPKAKPVTAFPVVKTLAVVSLHGVVWGPNDTPLADAEVQVPALRLTARTDYKGRFHFSGVPGEGQTKTLRVRAKGRELSLTTDQNYPDASKPLLIRFDKMED
ncbi:MAG: carboxypeptidase regulatory-like domain-containing protein [Terriglobia bacterium]